MDGIADHGTTTAETRNDSPVPPNVVRPEILEVLRRRGWRDETDQVRQNYQDTFDRLIDVLGRSPEMATVSWCIASNVSALIGDRDPAGWRWGVDTYGDLFLEKAVQEFAEFEGLFFARVRQLLPIARQMRDCQPVYDEGLADLVKALQPFARPRARAADPRSEWHATAELFASRIEKHFQSLKLDLPTRSSARSQLVLVVQSLLDMLGLRVEAETIRKVLRRSSADRLSTSTVMERDFSEDSIPF
jgi:hypothetical protein